MKYLFTTTIFSILLVLTLSAQEISFQGKINGIEDAELNVEVLPLKIGEIPIFKKIKSVNGEFECSVKLNLDMWHLIRINSKGFETVFDLGNYEKEIDRVVGNEKSIAQNLLNQEIVFFIQPNDHVFISAIVEKYGINYQVTGNKIGNQENVFNSKNYALEKEFNQLTIQKEKLRLENQRKNTNEIDNKIKTINSQIENNELALIKENPYWNNSAQKLAKFPIDTISKYFKILSNDVQNSFFGIYLSKIMTASDIGSSVLDFILPNEDGDKVSLSDFKGEYVVLDFWGTWCGYCLKGIPKMKDYYSKYKDKVEFINIGCRDKKNIWLKTVEKLEIEGMNLFAENDNVPDKFGVVGYPTKIIIDKDGKIISKTIGESDEFYDKLDELFNKN